MLAYPVVRAAVVSCEVRVVTTGHVLLEQTATCAAAMLRCAVEGGNEDIMEALLASGELVQEV